MPKAAAGGAELQNPMAGPCKMQSRSDYRTVGIRVLFVLLLVPLCPTVSKFSFGQNSESRRAENKGNLVSRGKYLADGVAVCSQCHTARDANGNLDSSKWLEGGSLWLRPARPTEDWPLQAPRIAGSPDATDDQLVTLLTTGIWKDGRRLRPPMPQFRMSREDALAVVAYLRSLSPKPE